MIEAIVLLGSRLPGATPPESKSDPVHNNPHRQLGAAPSARSQHIIRRPARCSITTNRSFHPDACPHIRYLPFLASAYRI
jgi:hypothetical protein